MDDLDSQVMDQEYKKELLEILYIRSFRFDPEKGFKLTSGAMSDVYIDVKKTALSSEAMELIGSTFFNILKMQPVDAIGGMTLGADPLAYAAAMFCTLHGKYMDAFVIRKEPKKHGTEVWVEGNIRPDASVVIVEDVVTTGGSTIKAVERARAAGLDVRAVIALVDREEGGREKIEEATKLPFVAVYTKTDFLELHKERTEKAKKKPEVVRPDF